MIPYIVFLVFQKKSDKMTKVLLTGEFPFHSPLVTMFVDVVKYGLLTVGDVFTGGSGFIAGMCEL